MTWFWVSLPYATFGIAINDYSTVIKTAPIAKWMIGKNIKYIENWINSKKGIIREIK